MRCSVRLARGHAAADTTPAGTAVAVEFGPPLPDSISGPSTPSSSANRPTIALAPAKSIATDEAASGTFYVDEPLRYVSASEGEKWRAATTKKIARCAET